MKKFNKIIIFVMLVAVLATCFVGCTPNDEKLIKDVNALVKGENVLGVTLGSYTLPTVSAELAKSGVTIEYSVSDYLGNAIEVKDGKFNIVVGGEYNINVTAKNKAGKVITEKTIRITENGVLSHKLSEADVAGLIAKKDALIKKQFEKSGVDYDKYQALSARDKHVADVSLDFYDSILSNGLFTSGLSKDVLNAIIDGVDKYSAASVDRITAEKDMPNVMKELLDKVLSPIFSGAESPLVVANIIYSQIVNDNQSDIDYISMEYDLSKESDKAFDTIIAMNDEQIKTYLTSIKTKVNAKIAELAAFDGINDDALYAEKLYSTLVEYGVVPSLSKEKLALALGDTTNLANYLSRYKANSYNTSDLFYILAGAELYSNESLRGLIVNTRTLTSFINKNMMDIDLDDQYMNHYASKFANAIDYSSRTANQYLNSLYSADEQDMSENIRRFKDSATNNKNVEELEIELKDLNLAKADLEKMKAEKASAINSFAMMVKTSEIISPVLNFNISQEFLVSYICSQIGLSYAPNYINKETGAIIYNAADLSAVLTSVDKQLDIFTTKYASEIDNFDTEFLTSFGKNLVDDMNLEKDGDKVGENTIANAMVKHLKLLKPLLASVKQLIGMANTTETIDGLMKLIPSSEAITAEQSLLLDINKHVGMSVAIKNVLDASKGDMTIDAYIASIKADIMADKVLADSVTEEAFDQYATMAKEIYQLANKTLELTKSKLITTMPDEAMVLLFEKLLSDWAEIMPA